MLCLTSIKIGYAKEEIIVQDEYLNARSGPGTNYEIVKRLKQGESYSVIKKQDDWIKIRLNNDKKAWVASWLVSEINSTENEGRVTSEKLRVRSGPSTSDEVLGSLKKGEQVKIVKQDGEWLQISFKEQKGWVHHSYISFEANKSENQEISPPYATITASQLVARAEPSFNGKHVMTLSKENSYTLLKEKNNWVQLQLTKNKKGWVPKWYTDITPKEKQSTPSNSKVEVLYDNVPLRETSSAKSDIIKYVSKGDKLSVTSIKDHYYEVKLRWGKKAYVAGWLVKADSHTPQIKKPNDAYTFHNKTIIIDPGHGGNDSGTVGALGTLEKDLTLETALLLQKKLVASGADVIITRANDDYQSLSARVRMSNFRQADAFISIHYDSAEQNDVRGITPYYYHSYQQPLANSIYESLEKEENLKIRPARFGDYHVLRNNSQEAVLLELGYLSNPNEEEIVISYDYQKTIVQAIYNGLGTFFQIVNNAKKASQMYSS